MAGPVESSEAQRRRLLGAWYTPPELVDHVVDVACSGLRRRRRPLRVLDPACGDGRFLTAVAERLGGRAELCGVDVDAAAVRAARRAVPGAEIVHADALDLDWAGRRFDVVIGNPPFLGQLASATSRGGSSRFGGGPYADVAAEFLALSVELADPEGGRVALVLPQSMLTTRDAAPIRERVAAEATVSHLWWSDTPMFDAAVRTCAVVLVRGARGAGPAHVVARTSGPDFAPAPPMHWRDVADATGRSAWGALLLARPVELPTVGADRLGDLVSFTVDFRDQYYGLVGAVVDDVDATEHPPLVTSGLIEPGRCLWGERPVRFAKQRYAAPRVDLGRLGPEMRAWAARRAVPKLLVANQTRVIEAVDDPLGAWLPGVPVITCVAHEADPGRAAEVRTRVAEVLAGPAATAWVHHHGAGSGLSAGTVRLSPALLASIPLPA